MNKKLTAPELDIQEFVKRFENESRDISAQRKAIVDAVHLQPGDAVADLGAGTGLFTYLFAERVGSKGKVYAGDIGPAFLKHIAKQAYRLGQERVVKTVLGTQDSTNDLPEVMPSTCPMCSQMMGDRMRGPHRVGSSEAKSGMPASHPIVSRGSSCSESE